MSGVPGQSPVSGRHFRDVLGNYPTGVALVTAMHPVDGPVGLVVGSFTSVSLDPPLVAFLPRAESASWKQLEQAGCFCVNILTSGQERLCREFAARHEERFDRHGWTTSPNGSPMFHGSAAWIDCDVEAVHEAGDHLIVVGRVRAMDHGSRTALPLLFFRGGYGSFRSPSLLSGDVVVMKELRLIDEVRAEFEDCAAAREAECLATTLVEDAIVTLASAGRAPHRPQPMRRIGHRQPFAAPFGAYFAAWMDDAAVDGWMRRGGRAADAGAREGFAALLDRTRRDGYSVTLGRDRDLELALLRAYVSSVAGDDHDPAIGGRIAELESAPAKPAPGEPGEDVVAIHVPVIEAGGRVRLAYTFTGFGANLTPAEIADYVQALRHLAELTVERSGHTG